MPLLISNILPVCGWLPGVLSIWTPNLHPGNGKHLTYFIALYRTPPSVPLLCDHLEESAMLSGAGNRWHCSLKEQALELLALSVTMGWEHPIERFCLGCRCSFCRSVLTQCPLSVILAEPFSEFISTCSILKLSLGASSTPFFPSGR